jgi:hypothetical protein
VAYTRKILGNIIAREFGVAQGIYESCEKYHQEVGEYRDFLPSRITMQELFVELSLRNGERMKIDAVVQSAFGNKCGYFSAFVCGIRRLTVLHGLQRGQVLELLYCALMCNGTCKFWIVCQKWLAPGNNSLFAGYTKGTENKINLVVEFFRRCKACGFGPQGGPKPRHSSAAGCWPGISEAEFVTEEIKWSPKNWEEKTDADNQLKCLNESLRRLDRFLGMGDWNEKKKTSDLLDHMCKKPGEGGVEHLGPVTSQAVFPLAAMLGLVTNLNRSNYGFIATNTPVHKKILEFEDMTSENMDSLLTGVAMRLNKSRAEAECLCCESHRKYQHYDLFFKGQEMFGCWKDDKGNMQIWQRSFNSSAWIIAADMCISPAEK